MIKAIETHYKGYRFRSRLEARWAVFFDALGLKWEYEPEGFELPDGTRYLPDFRIHGVDTNPDRFVYWFEVKGSPDLISRQEMQKMRMFAGGGRTLILLAGAPEFKRYPSINPADCEDCYRDGDFGEEYWLWSLRKRPWYSWEPDEHDLDYVLGSYHRTDGCPNHDLIGAINAARYARFEFGQCGAAA